LQLLSHYLPMVVLYSLISRPLPSNGSIYHNIIVQEYDAEVQPLNSTFQHHRHTVNNLNSWVLHPVALVSLEFKFHRTINTLCVAYIIEINGSVEVSGSFVYFLVNHT
jgi:hypothetical protein